MDTYQEKINALAADEAFCEKLQQADDAAKIAALFTEYDVPVSTEEVTQLLQVIDQNSGELSEEALSGISGGKGGGAVVVVVALFGLPLLGEMSYQAGKGVAKIVKKKTVLGNKSNSL